MLKTATAATSYEGYYLYLGGFGDYPGNANPGWHEDAQGLAHDRDHWFITQTGRLWRIPVSHDLGSVSTGQPGVTKIDLSQISQLSNFNHLGDLTYFQFEGKGFLIVPLEGSCSAVGIFDADTLGYIDSLCIGQSDAPWVAVDPSGILYSSNFGAVTTIMRYTVDWRGLKEDGKLIINSTNANNFDIFDEAGTRLQLNGLQGGEVSPSGELLYLMADGLHVFDMATHRRVQRSTKGYGYFNYEYHTDDGEEPEGITIWDLDDGRAPGIRGQLHAIMLDNDWPSSDDIYFKHYTGNITVDAAYNGVEGGTPMQPFNTVAEAHNLAWSGATISIRPGSFPETITLSKRVRVVAPAGSVQIGK